MNWIQTTHGQLQVQAAIDRFLRDAQINEVTKKNYRSTLTHFFEWHGNSSLPTKQDILSYLDTLRSGGLNENSVTTKLAALKSFFSYYSAEGLPNPTAQIKSAKRPSEHLKDSLTRDEVRRLMDFECYSVVDYRDKAVLMLKLAAGLRDVELYRANIGDLSHKRDQRILYVCGKGRTSKDEWVILRPEVYSTLLEYLRERGNPKSDEPLIATHGNKGSGRASARTLHRITYSRLLDAGLKRQRISPHTLRHTCADLAILGMEEEHGVADPLKVQKLLRHKSINTSLKYIRNASRLTNGAEHYIRW